MGQKKNKNLLLFHFAMVDRITNLREQGAGHELDLINPKMAMLQYFFYRAFIFI
jgi:hypothetical protein